MSDARRERAGVLIAQRRWDLAERELRLALADAPDDARLHALLGHALTRQGRAEDGEREAQLAVGLAPDDPFGHDVLGHALLQRDRFTPALEAFGEAVRLAPDDADHRVGLAAAYAGQERWRECLAAAEEGLALDPENQGCANLRSTALTQLGRGAEAIRAIDGALARDPDDAMAHANRGWACLHANDPRAALEHYRAALALDPDCAFARNGLIEAIKARNPLYRAMLAYFLWMSRLGRGSRWAVIIGILVGRRVLAATAQAQPALAPYLWPVVWASLAFVLLTWLARPLSDVLLRLHPVGRYALDRERRVGADLVGGCLALALIAAGLWLGLHDTRFRLCAIIWVGMTLPMAALYEQPRARRRALGALAAVLAVIASALCLDLFADVMSVGLFQTLMTAFAVGVVASTWAGAALASRRG